MPPIYLDHHATTPLDERVLEQMLPYFREKFGNAGATNHEFGSHAAAAVELSRNRIADLLNAPPKSIVFTSGATEANNLALKGILAAAGSGKHVVTSAIEHQSVLGPLQKMVRRGYRVSFVPVDSQGMINPEEVVSAIQPETVLVSVMWANNEVGAIQPIQKVAELCRSRRILFHTDAAQAVGKLPIDLCAVPVDLLSLSGHKVYGPQGVGVLYVRSGAPRVRLEPLFDGGGQEGGLRSGTLPVPLIVGLGAACDIAAREWLEESVRLRELAVQLRSGLSVSIPDLRFNGPAADSRLPGNVHVSVPGIDGTALLAALKDIAVSSGAACTTANPEPSHVLRAMGISESLSLSSIRFGLGRSTTSRQIELAIQHFCNVVMRLRAVTGQMRGGDPR